VAQHQRIAGELAAQQIRFLAGRNAVIWGEQDAYLALTLIDRLDRWVPDLRVERIPDASHWVQNDVPDRVNRLLIEFFKA